MTIKELKRRHFPDTVEGPVNLVEVTDAEVAKSMFHSRCSCCWGNKVLPDTGWAVVMTPSRPTKGAPREVLVCREALLKGEKEGMS